MNSTINDKQLICVLGKRETNTFGCIGIITFQNCIKHIQNYITILKKPTVILYVPLNYMTLHTKYQDAGYD
jgi:hypothetical protein